MTDSHHNGDGAAALPAELELALRSATWRALTTLQTLRTAVRDHVHHECALGSSQNEIDDGLRLIISECGPVLGDADYSAARTDEVTKQVLAWSARYGGER